MENRLTILAFTLMSLFFSGCGSKDPLVLLKPSDTEVWATSKASGKTDSTPDRTKLLLKTNKGDIVIELFDKESPITTANFLSYVDSDFYDNTLFHRVISGFMIQGGGFTVDLKSKPVAEPIVNEAGNGLKNLRGTLAMARTSDVNSATSQFFINVVNNSFLNGDGVNDGYAVFGRVYEGMDIVDQIAAMETSQQSGMGDVPVDPVIVLSVERL